ncbi:m-AAA protease-interacting protein 1, mitochondrial [Malaclemys terrapin pileata]|uniref:m-AAA protease-interacting protein 1, mitochondrial n=1 Tax=Malaclemys terrapin pileata TaxID=2991368 RepID=UPI0023A8EDDE|nr:m-AAA protease-interacting protein 1, mitochondrial [Malaclemys terrapin pileata]
MALPSALRRCPGPVRAFSARLLAATARPGLEPRGPVTLTGARPPARFCASDEQSRRGGPPGAGGGRGVEVVGIPNPFIWVRTRLRCFFIRAYFDHEFSMEEFTKGAKQAFALVSKLLSQCKLDLLEEFVSKEVFQVLEEKLSSLSENHRNALAADMDEIMYTTEGDVGIYFDDSGRKFVSILMRFWYLTSADLSDEAPDGTKVFHVVIGDETVKKTKHLLTANYEFRREFTEGVKADWTITRIEHPKLLE